MKYLYLHGLGQNADSWNKVTEAIDALDNSVCLNLAEMVKGKAVTMCSTMAELDFSDLLNQVCCPVLVVCGEKDKANKKASMELADILKHSKFKEISDTGHEVNLESPEKLASLLMEFYSSI